MQNHSSNTGFILIELIVALVIIGIMATIGIPRLYRAGANQLENFTSKLNGLVQEGLQRATTENNPYKIFFNFESGVRRVELRKTGKTEIVVSSIELPASIELQDLFINRKIELGRGQAWLFISPEGVTQEFMLNLTDPKTSTSGTYSLVLNPFSGQFKLYDSFQKPSTVK